MTLYRQLLGGILVLFVLMFAGTLTVNLHSTRVFLKEQLESHAQDTATYLGLSLSPHMLADDMAAVRSMVDAVFDRGYYREIRLRGPRGRELITRSVELRIHDVPAWFVDLVSLDAPRGSSLVMAGWEEAGALEVQSHPGYAYQELWWTFTRMLIWFAVTGVVVAILGAILLRVFLGPLRAVESQAQAIAGRRYEIQSVLPRTRELRRVVDAMNQMVAKVRAMFEEQAAAAAELRKLAYQDTLTGLGNRRYFDNQLEAHLDPVREGGGGLVYLIQLAGLRQTNDERGFEAGDTYLQGAADALRNALHGMDDAVCARLGGGDFVVLAPPWDGSRAEDAAGRLVEHLVRLFPSGVAAGEHVANVGFTAFQPGDSATRILSQADLALRTAQSMGPNVWYRYRAGEGESGAVQGAQSWRRHMEGVLEGGKLVLYGQRVAGAADPGSTLHREVFLRIPGADGELLSAGTFLPMAEQVGLARDFDRGVFNLLMIRLEQGSRPDTLAVNLSRASLDEPALLQEINDRLRRAPFSRTRLVFEFPECWAYQNLDTLDGFTRELRVLGHGFGLDHFGRGFRSVGYLWSLRPEYVKIDAAYTRRLSESPENQFFIRTLCSAAHSLDIVTIAEAVEVEDDVELLRSLGVDGIQGYVVERPGPLEEF